MNQVKKEAREDSRIQALAKEVARQRLLSQVSLKNIKNAKKKKEYNKALELGKTYLKIYPKDVDVMLLMGMMHYYKKQYSAASLYVNKILNISPHYRDAKILKIKIEIAQKHFHKALLLITKARLKAPADRKLKEIQIDIQKQEIKTKITLKAIESAKNKGNTKQALQLGLQYLHYYPKDVDVLLLMGVIAYQQKNYSEALRYLRKVLTISPNYLEAKLVLINVEIAQNKYNSASERISEIKKELRLSTTSHALRKETQKALADSERLMYGTAYKNGYLKQALVLAHKALLDNPNNAKVRMIMIEIYIKRKQFDYARHQYIQLLKQDPTSKKILKGYIELELMSDHTWMARSLLRDALRLYPNDTGLLMQQAALYFKLHMYDRSADISKKVVFKDPYNKSAKQTIRDVADISPHVLYGLNEIGGYSEVDYVSDLKQIWQYSQVYYNRNAPWGLFSVNVNDATRFGITSNQGVLNLYPVVNQNLYFRITGAYANQPRLFPNYVTGGEGYYAGLPVELSLGSSYSFILPHISFTEYTGSVSKEWGDYWISFRPFYYEPEHGSKSVLYTGTLVRYFGTRDTYAKLNLGTGTSPDLADLLTIDFIVIKMNFISFNLQIPLLKHKLLFNLGGLYQHWEFPNGKIREISGGTAGLNYRFEGFG